MWENREQSVPMFLLIFTSAIFSDRRLGSQLKYMSAKSLGWMPHDVSGFFQMTDHDDEAKAESCSNYAANDREKYRNTLNFKHDEF